MNLEELVDALCPLLDDEEEPDPDQEPARAPLDARALWGPADRFFEEDGLVCCLACSLVTQVCSEEDLLRKACGCDVSQGVPGRLLLPLELVGPPHAEVPVRLEMAQELRGLLAERGLLTGLRAQGADGLLPELRRIIDAWSAATSSGEDLDEAVRLVLDVAALRDLSGIRPQNLWTGGMSLTAAHELWARAAVAHIPARALLSVGELWWSILGPRSARGRARHHAPPMLKYLRAVSSLSRERIPEILSHEVAWLIPPPHELLGAEVFPPEDGFAADLHDWVLGRLGALGFLGSQISDSPGEPLPVVRPDLSLLSSLSSPDGGLKAFNPRLLGGLLSLFPAGRRPLPHESASASQTSDSEEAAWAWVQVGMTAGGSQAPLVGSVQEELALRALDRALEEVRAEIETGELAPLFQDE